MEHFYITRSRLQTTRMRPFGDEVRAAIGGIATHLAHCNTGEYALEKQALDTAKAPEAKASGACFATPWRLEGRSVRERSGPFLV
jgi:hypothetical protein